MADWKEKLRKLAEEQGMEIEAPSETGQAPKFGRKMIRHTEKIHFDKNPKFSRAATAPYNFVPLYEKPVTVERFEGFDSYDTANRKTGYIECEIEALTPIYIRGTRTDEEFQGGMESKAVSEFFSSAGETRLPGSSLRGMVRNLVEIVAWSRLATDGKRHYYYRGLADKSKLREEYQSHMASFDQKSRTSLYLMNAGYLEKVGTRYRITPAQVINKKQFDRILREEAGKRMAIAKSAKDFGKTYQFFEENGSYVVISGYMPKKKRDWVIHPPDPKAEKIWIPEEDLRNYRLDENRQAVDLLALLDKNPKLMLPCFYVTWIDRENRKRVSFGHTAMFRLAYEQSLGDLLPEEMTRFTAPDFTENLFGAVSDTGIQAGRVYFEDAILLEKPASPPSPEVPEILSTPKPTTFQHYLVQTSDALRELRHYNSETFLRGHKLYWHRRRNWMAKELHFSLSKIKEYKKETGKTLVIPAAHQKMDNDNKDKLTIVNFTALDSKLKNEIFEFILWDKKSQYTIIKALPQGTRFKATIRFENLTPVELGALLFALKLPDSCCHKIGMGKPLGLGSVKITPALFLSNRTERYTSLSAEWSDALSPTSAEIENFKAEFEKEIIGQLEADEKPASGKLWDAYRLRQLKALLNWDNTGQKDWDNRTCYLEIERKIPGKDKAGKDNKVNDYKDRLVLPLPEQVVSSQGS
jgi:CRISPR-associated protein (TIGR03986 family)